MIIVYKCEQFVFPTFVFTPCCFDSFIQSLYKTFCFSVCTRPLWCNSTMSKTKFSTKVFKAMSLKRRSIISLYNTRNTEGRTCEFEFQYSSFFICRANDFKHRIMRMFVNDNENIFTIRIWSSKINQYFFSMSAR